MITMSCEDVRRELSNYLDDEPERLVLSLATALTPTPADVPLQVASGCAR